MQSNIKMFIIANIIELSRDQIHSLLQNNLKYGLNSMDSILYY